MFYLFTAVIGDPFDENEVGQPPDLFIPDRITVNRGNTITIHFYNSENATEVVTEHHTFTIGSPYTRNVDLDAGENSTFTFTAGTSGIFQWRCTYHTPSMVGWFLILG